MKNTSRLYVVPIIIGLILCIGVFFTYFQLVDYEKRNSDKFQDEVERVIAGILERREGRVQTIASSMIGLFEASEDVTGNEFRNFSIRIFESNPEINNLFVLENSTIQFSYPNESFMNKNFDELFPNFPGEINGQKSMNIEFFMEDKKSIIVSVPVDYFISTENIPGTHMKIKLFSSVDSDTSIYQYSKINGLIDDENVIFTDSEKENMLEIIKQTSLYGHNLKQNYQLQYEIWSDVFVPDYLQSQITLIGGIIFSIIIIALIIRANLLKQNIEKHSQIVEQKNKELENIRKSKDEFITMIVHDLKNPLVPILSYSEILLSKVIGDLNDNQVKRIHMIKSSAENLQKLIKDLLDASKLDLGKLSLSKEDVNISEMLKANLSKFGSEFNKKEITVEEKISENVYCFCDKARIEQVLTNIFLNVLDFVEDKIGKVSVSLESDGKTCTICIKDNGVGMEKEQIDNLFIKFYQGNSNVKREYGGSGLGLAVSHGIITQHGGRLWAESDGIGKGSQFFIELSIR